MRSAVDLGVVASRTGHTRITRLYHHGAVAARITGTGAVATVHLVGSAAGPMSGDAIDITVTVGPAARLRLRSVAAALVLPGPPGGAAATRAEVTIRIHIAEDAEVDVELQPTIVTARARLTQATTIDVDPRARLRLREHLVGGRHSEAAGAWTAGLDVHRGEQPVLRQLMTDRSAPARVLVSGVDLAPAAVTPGAGHRSAAWGTVACGAVTCDLAAGGSTSTGWGPDLTAARGALDRLAR